MTIAPPIFAVDSASEGSAPASTPRSLTPSISAVVPAYNEGNNLARLLPVLCEVLRSLTDQWEVIIVNDGSRDHTIEAVAPWLVQPGVRLLCLSRNFGKEAALSAGLDRAQGQLVVLLDADLQHSPSLIPAMLALWKEGADTVCAVRQHRKDESRLKRWGARCFYGLVNAGTQVPIPAGAGDFRLMDRRVVNALLALPERNRFLKGMYAWVGFKTVELPYLPDPRAEGESTFSLRSLKRLALTGITSFSTLPLRLWSGIGVLIATFALAYGLWIVIEHLIWGIPVQGWATLAAGMMFFSGVQLLSIGILGEYVGRIFDEVKQRPIYLIDREWGQTLIHPASP